jgi:hypothetical protein
MCLMTQLVIVVMCNSMALVILNISNVMSNYNVCVVVKVKLLSMCVLIIKCHVYGVNVLLLFNVWLQLL